MKKYFILLSAALVLASCSGNKNSQTEENPYAEELAFQEEQIKAGMNQRLDSLTTLFLNMKPVTEIGFNEEGKVVLSADEKKVKPDYLFVPSEYDGKLETLSQKYRAIMIYYIDRIVAQAYDMSDIYAIPLAKLMTELNDPAINKLSTLSDKADKKAAMQDAYKTCEENGRLNYFWETNAAGIIERMFILSQNQDKLLAVMTDKDAEDITFQFMLLIEAYKELAEYNTDLRQLYNACLKPLAKIDAISVAQLREQLNSVKSDLYQSRSNLLLYKESRNFSK